MALKGYVKIQEICNTTIEFAMFNTYRLISDKDVDKASRVKRPMLYVLLITLVLTGIVFGIIPLLIGSDRMEMKGWEVFVIKDPAYLFRSYKETYESADLVVLGRVVSSELGFDYHELRNVTWRSFIPYNYSESPIGFSSTVSFLKVERVIKGEPPAAIIRVQGGAIGMSKNENMAYVIPGDPPLEVGEKIILFLQEYAYRVYDKAYPHTYIYFEILGRFEVVDDKVYSMMQEIPGLKLLERYRLPEQERIESVALILAYTDYEKINGIPLEDFIETLNAS